MAYNTTKPSAAAAAAMFSIPCCHFNGIYTSSTEYLRIGADGHSLAALSFKIAYASQEVVLHEIRRHFAH